MLCQFVDDNESWGSGYALIDFILLLASIPSPSLFSVYNFVSSASSMLLDGVENGEQEEDKTQSRVFFQL